MKKYIIIKADTNDGDYVSEKVQVCDSDIKVIEKVCNVLKIDSSWGTHDMKDDHNDPNRFINSGQLTEEEIDLFNSLTPSSEYGIHTIESVQLLEVTNETNLL